MPKATEIGRVEGRDPKTCTESTKGCNAIWIACEFSESSPMLIGQPTPEAFEIF